MTLLRDARDDFIALIGAASQKKQMPLEFVEKDYWATEVLRAVVSPLPQGHVVFKGGTSLSKAYRLIRRFSEDVDVLVVPRKNLSQRERNTLLKALCRQTQAHLRLAGEQCEVESQGRGQHRSVRFMHDLINDPTAVRPGTLLQLGIRGGEEPHQSMSLRSFVAAEALEQGGNDDEFDEFMPVQIRVLRPERTLIEKLYAVHDFCTGYPSTRRALQDGARHYYDISRLLEDDGVLEAMQDSAFDLVRLVEAVRDVSASYGGGRPLPRGGFASSVAFDTASSAFEELRTAYARVAALVIDPLTPLDDVVALVHAHAELLDPET